MNGTDIFVIVGLALVGAFAALFLKDSRLPVLAVVAALAVGAIIFIRLIPRVGELFDLFEGITERIDMSGLYLNTLFKVIGIAYVAEFGAQLCRDAGQAAIAVKVEFAAKVIILLLAMPIMASLLQSVLTLLG